MAVGRGLWALLDLIRFWRRSTRLAGHDGVAQGKLPTVGHARTHSITGFYVECRQPRCGNRRRLAFDEIGLPDNAVFVEIGRSRRFRCHRCGGREAIISADWPRPKLGSGAE